MGKLESEVLREELTHGIIMNMMAQLKITGSWRAYSLHFPGKIFKCCKEIKLLLFTHCVHW